MNIINDQDVIQILKNMLNTLDSRLVDHGERVTYLCMEIMNALHASREEYLNAAKLALFHDIGAYKTDEVDSLLGFEKTDVWEHAAYGYLFLARMSPLKDDADCILCHHMPYNKLLQTSCHNKKIASLIHLCDRIDVSIRSNIPINTLNYPGMFDPQQYEAFLKLNQQNRLIENIQSGVYHEYMQQLFSSLHFSAIERKQYLEMLAYSIDFNSEFTVLHTIMTTSLSLELGKQFHLNEEAMEKLYYGALLHDIGKGAIPIAILEKGGPLTTEEMKLMRTHVLTTETILNGFVDEEILHIASRHHEKLDGSGYPYHLKAHDLSLSERIVGVADILSALLGKRSYKDEFPVTKVIAIIQQLAREKKLDSDIVAVFTQKHEEILQQVTMNTLAIKHLYQSMQEDYKQLKANNFLASQHIKTA